MIETLSAEELISRAKEYHPSTWGRWTFDGERFVLEFKLDGHDCYEVDLDKCRDSAEILDWLAQLRHKTWITSQDLGDLVQALDDILHLQATMCGSGTDTEIDPREVAAKNGYVTTAHLAA